jgi:ATP adenylyltransferase
MMRISQKVREGINARQQDCIFCEVPDQRVVVSNALAFAILDKYPVTELHTLVISKRHVGSFFDLFEPERRAINLLLDQARTKIVARDSSVEGFNIGINSGEVAGQTIECACSFNPPAQR